MSITGKMASVMAVLSLLMCPPLTFALDSTKVKAGGVRRDATSGSSRIPIWSKNVKVPCRSWIPIERPKEVMLCVHGLGFSSKSYSEFGRNMAGRGVAVYAVDVRGFGAWLQKRDGQVDFEACLADLEAALHSLRKAYPGVPVFLVGESMGGAIALRETSRNPDLVDGLLCSVPSSDRYRKLSSELIVGMRYLEDKNKPMDLDTEVVNRATGNLALRKAMKADPNNHMKLTPAELKQFNDFMKGNVDAAALIRKTPTLMLAGFKDKLVKPEGTIDLFNELSCQDKLLMVVGDGEHLLLEENQLTPQLSQLVIDWIRNESNSPRKGITSHP
ncbi:MAG TPA: alpha/beta fold hydrolase [Planktothrix sp.]|jgi:alpha-beta hydrolase superfamily lysophospholipase